MALAPASAAPVFVGTGRKVMSQLFSTNFAGISLTLRALRTVGCGLAFEGLSTRAGNG